MSARSRIMEQFFGGAIFIFGQDQEDQDFGGVFKDISVTFNISGVFKDYGQTFSRSRDTFQGSGHELFIFLISSSHFSITLFRRCHFTFRQEHFYIKSRLPRSSGTF